MRDQARLANWLLDESYILEPLIESDKNFSEGVLYYTLPKLISNEIEKVFSDKNQLENLRKSISDGNDFIGDSNSTKEEIYKKDLEELKKFVIKESFNYKKYLDFTVNKKIKSLSELQKYADIAEDLLFIVYEYLPDNATTELKKFVKECHKYFKVGESYGNNNFKPFDLIKLIKSNKEYGTWSEI